jgi:hypothetical protein
MYDPLQVIALEMRVWLRKTNETTDTPNLSRDDRVAKQIITLT